MGVRINEGQAVNKPGLVYDNVFLVRLDIRQEHSDYDNSMPGYKVLVKYRMFGVDEDGKRHYSGEGIQTVSYKDYLSVALEKAAVGETAFLEAFAGIEKAVAAIVADHRETTATII